MKRCFEIQGCPASLYLICPAYKEKKSCWEILGVPCCKRNNKDRCLECSLYLNARKEET